MVEFFYIIEEGLWLNMYVWIVLFLSTPADLMELSKVISQIGLAELIIESL